MDKGSKRKQTVVDSVVDRLEGASSGASKESRDGAVWIREDGAVCIGNECMVIKPREGSRDLDIEIKPDMCGRAIADKFADAIYKTIGRGGATHFTVKSELKEE